jgi:hypothetical protein
MNKLIYLNPEFWFYCVFRLLNQIRHDGDKNFVNNEFLMHSAILIFSELNAINLMGLDIIFGVLKYDVPFWLCLIIPFYFLLKNRFSKILEKYKNVSQNEWKIFGFSYFFIFVIIYSIKVYIH